MSVKEDYIVEVRQQNRYCNEKYLIKYGFRSYRSYYKWSGSYKSAKKISRVMKRHGWAVSIYKKKYGRSDNYRNAYFSNNPSVNGLYYCVYCGRKLYKSSVQVDHVIPVGQAKSNWYARLFLKGNGVNDPSNLVASCAKCNQKKLDSIGLWPLKAFLGRHRSYFLIRRILFIFIIAIVICYLYLMNQRSGILYNIYNWFTSLGNIDILNV